MIIIFLHQFFQLIHQLLECIKGCLYWFRAFHINAGYTECFYWISASTAFEELEVVFTFFFSAFRNAFGKSKGG